MVLIICVDDAMGISFNNRRQSMDSALRQDLMKLSCGMLRMSEYSGRQFHEMDGFYAGSDYLSAAAGDAWIFAENEEYKDYLSQFDRIILYRWNRRYPADLYFDIPGEWNLIHSADFPGSSHEQISREEYCR